MTVVLSIPPYSTSAGLRSSYLLRLTGEVSESVDAFGLSDDDFALLSAPASASAASHPSTPTGAAAVVEGLLDVVDRGWTCCLEGQVWHPTLKRGLDPAPSSTSTPTPRSVPQTDRVRLSSLLLNLRSSIRAALALPPAKSGTTSMARAMESETTPSMTTDLDSTSASDDEDDGGEDGGPRGDAAATMAMRLDPDASDDDEDGLASAGRRPTDSEMETDVESRERQDALTAGALEESVERLFHRTLGLLNEM